MPVTMNDIARTAGVSRQAVAAALNPKGTSKVSEKMRNRILHIAKLLNYIPNQAARHLKGVANHTIGVYGAPYAYVEEQTYFNELSQAFDRHGYNLITSYGINKEAAERAVRDLLGKGIDGLIITTAYNPLAESGLRTLIPSIFCPPARIENADIFIDHAAGTFLAAEHLLKQCCQKGVYLSSFHNKSIFSNPGREKFDGLKKAFEQYGKPLSALTVEECNGKAEEIIRRLKKLAPDVIFCCNDYFAGRLISALLMHGIRVPEEIKVIGYDGLALCDLCAVPLATVIQPIRKKAELTVELMLKRIEAGDSDSEPARTAVTPYFYPSASCGAENEMLKEFPIYDDRPSLEMTWTQSLRNIINQED